MPIYPTLAVTAAVAVVVLELRVFRSGLFRERAYWISMAICFAFMIPVDGWLTKQSAPIVEYRPEDTSGVRPISSRTLPTLSSRDVSLMPSA